MKKLFFILTASVVLFAYGAKAQTAKILSSSVFSDSLQTHENCSLLDVRTPEEFNGGHLKNATNLDFTNPDFKTNLVKLDKNKSYYVYCHSGKRSSGAATLMKSLGFKNVYELQGGIMKWKQDGMQTVKTVE
ncbi:MAG TPA: rhodanese-like domain-containing protein [Pelobium sp.]